MSAVALKVSADLAATLRTAAEEADRSMSGQLEHWAKLGRAAEAALPPLVAAALKRCAGDLSREEDPALRQRTLAALDSLSQLSPEELRSRLGLDRSPVYEPDPARPGGVIRTLPDGTRASGRLEGRTFVPDPS